MWKVKILTIHPDMFPGPLEFGVCGRAMRNNIWQCETVNIKDYGVGNHKKIDHKTAGGGPGMVLRPDVMAKAFDQNYQKNTTAVVMSPKGKTASQQFIKNLAKNNNVLIICGRFEAIDQRFIDNRPVTEISLGDFILAGGEIAAMAIIEAVVRILPKTINNNSTLENETFENQKLQYPQYTKPDIWENIQVPEILKSGNHQKIKKWRHEQACEITKKIRPDLAK